MLLQPFFFDEDDDDEKSKKEYNCHVQHGSIQRMSPASASTRTSFKRHSPDKDFGLKGAI